MKKLFTILFSVLFSMSLLAQETNFIEEKGSFSSKAADCPANSLFDNGGESGGWALSSSTNQGIVNYFKFHDNMLAPGAVIEGFHTWGLMAFYDGAAWAPCEADNMEFLVSFFADNEGEPGELINAQTVTAAAITTTDIAFGTWTVKRMEITLTTPVAFNEGFISIASTNAATCWFMSISAEDGEQNVYMYNDQDEFVQRMITPTDGDPYAASVLLCVTGTVSEIVSATINPTEVTIDYDDEEAVISTVITWNDATELTKILISSPNFSEIEGELNEDDYSIVDNGDGTATFSFDPNQPKVKSRYFEKYTMVIHFNFVFNVGNEALLVINVDNYKWTAAIEVKDKVTGNPIQNAAVHIQEIDETHYTDEWGWADIDLDSGTYSINISANGYVPLQNQVIDVEAGFDNEFIYELDPAFNTYFHYGVVDDTRPDWFSNGDHTERGLTADEDNVYVVSRKGGLQVLVLDRITGLETGVLNVNGITGGFWVLNDIEISADGHLAGFNMLLNGGQFKTYLLDETNDPEVLFTTDIVEGRYGDKVTMVGSFDDGSAVIYAANGSAPNVLKWTMETTTGGKSWGFNPTPQNITLSDVPAGAAGTPAVAPLPNGSFYWTANGRNVTKHNADGTLIGTISGGILATGTNAMKYLGRMGNDEILAVFAYGANNEIAKVVRVLNGNPETTELLFNTPTLRGGSATSNPNGTGDVAFLPYPDGNVALYVLGTNIGIGGYASIYFDLAFPVYPPADLVSATINPTEATIDMDTGGIITTVITWNDASELTKVLITFPDFPELEAQELTPDAYTLVDNGDGTSTFSFDTDQPKGVSDWFGKYTMNALLTFIFDVGDDAVLNLTIENWTWWVEIEVTDKVTGNPIQNAAVHIQELDETHHTDQWGWADIDLDVGTYTLNISAAGYVALPSQVIEVEANFDNEFHFELEPVESNIDETELAGIAIFPNPATTLLNISSENPIMEISLTNMLGQVIYLMEQAGNSHSINISSFNKGIYFVRIATENEVLVRKVLIRK